MEKVTTFNVPNVFSFFRVMGICCGMLMYFPAIVSAQDRTNDEVLSGLIVRHLLDFNEDLPEQPFVLRINAPAHVHADVAAALLARGHTVLASTESGHPALQIDISTQFTYFRIRKKTGERTLQGTLTYARVSPAGEIIFARNIPLDYQDRVQTYHEDLVRGDWSAAAFSRMDNRGRQRFLKRVAEPALISGVVALTVYLLFNVRSQ